MNDELLAVNALERLRAFVRNSTVALTAIHYDDASAILAHIDALTAERDAAIGDKGNAEQCARDGWEAAHRLLTERDAARAAVALQAGGIV